MARQVRAIQVTPAPSLTSYACFSWMADTPVGHDNESDASKP
jgi:hypothetical protein